MVSIYTACQRFSFDVCTVQCWKNTHDKISNLNFAESFPLPYVIASHERLTLAIMSSDWVHQNDFSVYSYLLYCVAHDSQLTQTTWLELLVPYLTHLYVCFSQNFSFRALDATIHPRENIDIFTTDPSGNLEKDIKTGIFDNFRQFSFF